MEDLKDFRDLGLSEKTIDALRKKGFEEPTEIQKKTIPLLLTEGTEVVGQAQTGTGKTAAFALPIIETVSEENKNVQALILCPTRELALQVAEEINSLKGDRKLEIIPIYGGASMEVQLRRLRRGVQIVVGTPGRILDHINRGSLKLDDLEFMVLDEADEMLDMGFIEDIEEVLKAVPEEKRMLLFSATIPPEIEKLSQKFMKNPIIIRTQKVDTATPQADQIYFEVKESDKIEALSRIIDRDPDFYGIVFCRTKLQCDEVASKLQARGYDAEALHGDLSQREREQILKKLKERQIRILVATDVAARGLDIKDLTHIINYALPQDPEIYIHRVGRTGRAGRTGTAITFITPSEARKFSYIKKVARSEIRKEEVPTAQEVIETKRQRIKEELEEALDKSASDDYEKLAKELLEGKDPENAMASLLEYFYKGELDKSQYRDISVGSSKDRKSRREREKERDREPRAERDRSERHYDSGLDSEGYTRLFIAKGRRDGLSKRELLDFIEEEAHIDSRDLHNLEVMDEFSFVNAPYDVAEKILRTFEDKNTAKPLVEKANNPDIRPNKRKGDSPRQKKEALFKKQSEERKREERERQRQRDRYPDDEYRRDLEWYEKAMRSSKGSRSTPGSSSRKKSAIKSKNKTRRGRR